MEENGDYHIVILVVYVRFLDWVTGSLAHILCEYATNRPAIDVTTHLMARIQLAEGF